jgi:hypothetical protein
MDRPATKRKGYLWNPQAETMPRAELTALQTQRLQQQVARANERVLFYRQALEEHGVHPRDIQTLDDIERLPITVKEDFRTTYPYGLFAVPLKDVVRLHASSGTTGWLIRSGCPCYSSPKRRRHFALLAALSRTFHRRASSAGHHSALPQ